MAILVDDVHWAPCDRIARHEDQLGDVTVRQALCRQPCHPEVSRRQRVDAGDRRPARPRAGHQLLAKLGLEPRCATSTHQVETRQQMASRTDSLAGAPQHTPARRRLKFCPYFFESADGLLQRLERFVSRFGECTTSQRNA